MGRKWHIDGADGVGGGGMRNYVSGDVCGWLSDDCPDKNDRRERARARSQLHKQALSPIMRIYALRILERALLRTCKLLQHIFAARAKSRRVEMLLD